MHDKLPEFVLITSNSTRLLVSTTTNSRPFTTNDVRSMYDNDLLLHSEKFESRLFNRLCLSSHVIAVRNVINN
jgi:hypothetical protein